jgi:hypothetical protein
MVVEVVVMMTVITFNLLTCWFNSTSVYYKASTKTQINTYNNAPTKNVSPRGQALPSVQLTCVPSTSACVSTLTCSSITKTSWLMLCNEIVSICYENRMKQIRTYINIIYTHTYMHTYIHTYTHIGRYIHTQIYTHRYMHACKRTYIHTHT